MKQNQSSRQAQVTSTQGSSAAATAGADLLATEISDAHAPSGLRSAAKKEGPAIPLTPGILKDISKSDRRFLEVTVENLVKGLRDLGHEVVAGFPGNQHQQDYYGGCVIIAKRAEAEMLGQKREFWAAVGISPRKTFDISSRESGTLYLSGAVVAQMEEPRVGGGFPLGTSLRSSRLFELPAAQDAQLKNIIHQLEGDLGSAIQRWQKDKHKNHLSEILTVAFETGPEGEAMRVAQGIPLVSHDVVLDLSAEDLPFQEARQMGLGLKLGRKLDFLDVPVAFGEVIPRQPRQGFAGRGDGPKVCHTNYGETAATHVVGIDRGGNLPLEALELNDIRTLKGLEPVLQGQVKALRDTVLSGDLSRNPFLHLAVYEALRLPGLFKSETVRMVPDGPATAHGRTGPSVATKSWSVKGLLDGEWTEIAKLNLYTQKCFLRGNSLILPEGKQGNGGLHAYSTSGRTVYYGECDEVIALPELGTPIGAGDRALVEHFEAKLARLEASRQKSREKATVEATTKSLKEDAKTALDSWMAPFCDLLKENLNGAAKLDHFAQDTRDPNRFYAKVVETYPGGYINRGFNFRFAEGKISDMQDSSTDFEVRVETDRLNVIRAELARK